MRLMKVGSCACADGSALVEDFASSARSGVPAIATASSAKVTTAGPFIRISSTSRCGVQLGEEHVLPVVGFGLDQALLLHEHGEGHDVGRRGGELGAGIGDHLHRLVERDLVARGVKIVLGGL